jgi:hypothetical protein
MVNIVQLMIALMKKLKPCGGGFCCSRDFEVLIEETYEEDLIK